MFEEVLSDFCLGDVSSYAGDRREKWKWVKFPRNVGEIAGMHI